MHNDKKSVHTGKHRLLFKVVFGLGTFFLLFFLFDPKTILATLAGTRLTYLLWAFVCCLFVLLARAFRWMVILKDMGIHAMFWRIVEIYTISLWFNTFLPGSVGGDIYKVYGLVQDGSRTIQSLATVFIERFTGLMALITVAVLSVLFFSHMMPAPPWMLLSLIAIVAGGLFLLLFATRLTQPVCLFLRTHIPFLKRYLTDDHITFISDMFGNMLNERRLFVRAYGLGLVMQILVLTSYYVVSLALNEHIPFLFFLVFFPLIEIISLIPITINGMGVRELVLVFFLKYAEVSPSFAISFSILVRLILVVFALFGGYLLIRKRAERT